MDVLAEIRRFLETGRNQVYQALWIAIWGTVVFGAVTAWGILSDNVPDKWLYVLAGGTIAFIILALALGAMTVAPPAARRA